MIMDFNKCKKVSHFFNNLWDIYIIDLHSAYDHVFRFKLCVFRAGQTITIYDESNDFNEITRAFNAYVLKAIQ